MTRAASDSILRQTLRGLALLPFLASAPALDAYELLDLSWAAGRVEYRINPNFPDTELTGTPAKQLEIIRDAAAAWRDQSAADFEFVYEGTSSRIGFNLNDGVNNFSFSAADGGDALAATVIDGFRGRATAFDIVFFGYSNGEPVRWNGPQDPPSGTFDLTGVAVHELGHALGLDHSTVRDATMFASARNRGRTLRTLFSDDIDGVEFIYGTRPDADPGPAIFRLEPANGPGEGGNEVVVVGRNFTWTSDTILQIGAETLSSSRFDVESLSHLRIHNMPPGSEEGPVDVTLRNELGEITLAGGYRYGAPAPVLVEIDPPLGPVSGGVQVTVRGRHLTPEAEILVGGTPVVNLQFIDGETLTGELPQAVGSATVDVVLVQGADTSVLPGAFTYTAKVLTIGESEGAPGQTDVPVNVFVSSDEDLRGFSFALSFDPSLITVDDVTVDGTEAERARFAAPNIDNESGVATFGVIMSYQSDNPRIPQGEGRHVAIVKTTISGAAPVGAGIPLNVEPRGGSPPIDLLFTPLDDPLGTRPFAVDGKVTVSGGPLFIRGDADSNGRLELTDAIFHLSALFRGGPLSACADATDSNDDGISDLSDGVYSLVFLFSGGPAPQPPFPNRGVDPSPDALGCDL